MADLLAWFRDEERQYAPFVAAALLFAAVLGFPLGLLLAHAAAQQSTLDGRWPALAQLHGHLQLMGWFGLFVMGMGLRLVPRFTAVHIRPRAVLPATFALMACGLAARAIGQTWARDGEPFAALFAGSAALEAAAALLFAWAVLRCLQQGRAEDFHYSPFFAAGALWLAVALLLNLAFVLDAALNARATILPARSAAITFVQLYGFVSMFVFAVSLRMFPVFFGRERAPAVPTLAAWALANVGVAVYAGTLVWRSYETQAATRPLLAGSFLAVGAAFLATIFVVRIFRGKPHRLRESARRSMRFVRSAYAWLLVGGGMQVFFGARALWEDLPPAYYEVDAVRHFLALGFLTMIIIGMSLLVLPRLAMRRMQARQALVVGPLLLALLYGAAAARGAGSLLANDAELNAGFWTMSAGGTFGVLAMLTFAGYLLWSPRQAEIPLAVRQG